MENKTFYDKDDVKEIMKISKSKAYLVIRGLNLKLMEEKNLPKECIRWGRVEKKYFHENIKC